jgi:hypothetical protein
MRAKRIYFLRPVGEASPIKIGCSVFPEGRLDTFNTWSPVPLEIITSVPGSHADEKTLHGMFVEHHVHGEWFRASKALLALLDYCLENGDLPPLPKVIKFPNTRQKAHTVKRPPGPDRRAWAARVRAEYERGKPVAQISDEHSICAPTVRRLIKFAGGKLTWQHGESRGPRDMKRASEMARRYLDGETLQQIGTSYGVTRERVRQVLASLKVERRHNGPTSRRAA